MRLRSVCKPIATPMVTMSYVIIVNCLISDAASRASSPADPSTEWRLDGGVEIRRSRTPRGVCRPGDDNNNAEDELNQSRRRATRTHARDDDAFHRPAEITRSRADDADHPARRNGDPIMHQRTSPTTAIVHTRRPWPNTASRWPSDAFRGPRVRISYRIV